jgi:hypothetical protein
MPGRGTHENRYLIEIDGIGQIRASEVTMPGKEHTPVELYVGNQKNPLLLLGNFKVEALTIKHASALNETRSQYSQWLDDFLAGIDLQRRTARMVVTDEDGVTPVEECVPTSFKLETHSASGTGASMFTIGLRPENMVAI